MLAGPADLEDAEVFAQPAGTPAETGEPLFGDLRVAVLLPRFRLRLILSRRLRVLSLDMVASP